MKVIFKLGPLKGVEQGNETDADLLRQGLLCAHNPYFIAIML